jgi:hypothetical protein
LAGSEKVMRTILFVEGLLADRTEVQRTGIFWKGWGRFGEMHYDLTSF